MSPAFAPENENQLVPKKPLESRSNPPSAKDLSQDKIDADMEESDGLMESKDSSYFNVSDEGKNINLKMPAFNLKSKLNESVKKAS